MTARPTDEQFEELYRRALAEIARLTARIAELEAALDSMTVERGTAQAERDEILHDKHDRIAELEAALQDALSRVRSWEGAAHEYEEQARFARAQTTIAEAERDTLSARVIAAGEVMYRDKARIAELEAERDRLKAALKPFASAFAAIKRDHPEYLQADFITAYFTPAEFADARALSDPSGE